MLGAALQKLRDYLETIPGPERTLEQRDLLKELSALSEMEDQLAPVLDKLRPLVDISKLSFFSTARSTTMESSVTRPDPGGTKCAKCGQYFPVITQPKA